MAVNPIALDCAEIDEETAVKAQDEKIIGRDVLAFAVGGRVGRMGNVMTVDPEEGAIVQLRKRGQEILGP